MPTLLKWWMTGDKIFELLMEIGEKSNTLRQLVEGSYFV